MNPLDTIYSAARSFPAQYFPVIPIIMRKWSLIVLLMISLIEKIIVFIRQTTSKGYETRCFRRVRGY